LQLANCTLLGEKRKSLAEKYSIFAEKFKRSGVQGALWRFDRPMPVRVRSVYRIGAPLATDFCRIMAQGRAASRGGASAVGCLRRYNRPHTGVRQVGGIHWQVIASGVTSQNNFTPNMK